MRVLEFSTVLEHVAAEASSCLGAEGARALTPAVELSLITRRLAETQEGRTLLSRGPVTGLERARDIRGALTRAAVAGTRLPPSDLLAIADTLEAAEQIRRHLRQSGPDLRHLAALAEGLRPPTSVARDIRRCLLPDGSVADEASPDLFHLRAQTRRAREAVRESLQALLASRELLAVIAEPVITIRNDRYVIPVLPGYRAYLSGIIQDQSGTGHTLFLEPLAVVEQNNAIRRLERESEEEADRILGELTALVRGSTEDIGASVEALAALDLALAKARVAERWGACQPQVADRGPLRLFGARHPLLVESRRRRQFSSAGEASQVVPIDVPLRDDRRVLVITGPNAGGKTVALKTVGLLALMAQAGLHIPASPDSALPVFRAIFADIGDEQSIAQDLSTFSAHVTRLTGILAAADEGSLVLLDEIGAGTDPGEGAALGNAILDELAWRNSHVLATTHLDGIKAFVAMHGRMENGAVEFDLDRMQPVYKLHIGYPGRSFAIDVAFRLGVPPPIVQRAREFAGDSNASVATLLDRLRAIEAQREEDVEMAAREREAAARAHGRAEEAAGEYEALLRNLRVRMTRAVGEVAAEARRRVEAVVAELRREGSVREARQKIQELTALPEEQLAEFPEAPSSAEAPSSLVAVEPGQHVRIRHLGQEGSVLGPANAQGLVEVQLPVGKVRVPLDALSPAAPAVPRTDGVITWKAGAGDSLSDEIKVIGCTVEEATRQVGRYLEDAMLGGLSRVRIVHGKGTGRLRRGLADFLKTHPLVSDFHLASFDEGGAGATIVSLGSKSEAAQPPSGG